MKTTIAIQKPDYNTWLKYIHKEVKRQIIDWPKNKVKTAAEIELQKLYDQRKNAF